MISSLPIYYFDSLIIRYCQNKNFTSSSSGSSAGAGSEVFHVYRHLRRRETIRQQFIDTSAKKEILEEEFQDKLIKNYIQAEEKTSKKRAKRYIIIERNM